MNIKKDEYDRLKIAEKKLRDIFRKVKSGDCIITSDIIVEHKYAKLYANFSNSPTGQIVTGEFIKTKGGYSIYCEKKNILSIENGKDKIFLARLKE